MSVLVLFCLTVDVVLKGTLQPTAAAFLLSSDCLLLFEGNEQTNYHREESCAFNESCGQDHVSADVTGCFRLACDRLERAATDTADTYTCTESCYTCTESGKTVTGAEVFNSCL
jgi:hypothetical protein